MSQVREWVRRFFDHADLVEYTVEVLLRVPEAVREDLLGDPNFVMNAYDADRPGPVVLRLGALNGGAGTRSVSLKVSLPERGPEFATYVIAHEFAHAFLRNVCRPPGEDVESAADALAAEWGFPRPAWSNPTGVVWRFLWGARNRAGRKEP